MPLHPQAETFLRLAAENDTPKWHQMPPSESRELFSSFKAIFGDGPELHEVRDEQLDGVAVRFYRPSATSPLPVIVYFHGGGWVLGNLDTHDSLCRRLARASDCVVVAVDYRLAPESKYPAALDDSYRVTQALVARSSEFGCDASALVVVGDSAGGNLAAAVCLKARDEQGPTIAGQVLIYPVIEPDFETESYRAFATDYGLLRETMQWFWDQYVDGVGTDLTYAKLGNSPLGRLPRAHVITAEYDVLRDEGERFARQLKDAGNLATSTRYDGMLHGFVHFGGMFDDSGTAIDEIAHVVRDMTT